MLNQIIIHEIIVFSEILSFYLSFFLVGNSQFSGAELQYPDLCSKGTGIEPPGF
jgi:hypothetical protein